jgi:hypothetical protein
MPDERKAFLLPSRNREREQEAVRSKGVDR